MAVANQTPCKEYIGNGTTKIFPLEFDCDDADHLIVKVNDIEVPALNNWSLNTNTGSVVFAIAPISQSKIILQRDTPLVRDTDYQTYNNSFRPEPVNKDFDHIWWKLQEIWLQITLLWLGLKKEVKDRIESDLAIRSWVMILLNNIVDSGLVSAIAITTVENISDLQNLIKWDGRTIYVKSADVHYVYNSSLVSTNDGGYIVNGWVAQILDNTLTPEMFGAFPDSTRENAGTDCSDSINKMFSVAVNKNFHVCFNSSLHDREKAYYITKPIVATGIHKIKGIMVLHARSSFFDSSLTSYMLCLGDPNTNYTTIQGYLDYERIILRDLDKRSKKLRGVFLKYTAIVGGEIRALDINGRGIHGSPVFDSTLGHIAAERCGNVDEYAITFDGNGDESNSITFNAILCHDAYHKGVFISGSKHNIVRAHLEANAVLVSNDGFSISSPLAIKYVNHYIYLVSGNLGYISINDYDYADSKTYFDDLIAINKDNPSHLYLKLDRCSTVENVFNLTDSKSDTSIKNTGVITIDTGDTYSTVSSLCCGTFNAVNSTRVTIQNANIYNYYSSVPSVIIKGGVINSWGLKHIGTFYDTRFNSSVFGDDTSYTIATNCTFNAGITKLTASTLNRFTNCKIPLLNLSTENKTERATIIGGNIGSIGGNSVINGTSTNPKDITFDSVTLQSSWNLNNGIYNICRFIGTGNKVSGGASISGAKQERYTAVNTICQNMNTVISIGEAIIYVRTANNSDGSGTYQTIAAKS